ncbi:hypothetical protein [Bacillus sp. FJAT-27251]|uniref:hypothetical protein n=1 Tax=Bacillus sp. FJAT-27251 TaxID=1684142 RepID=UPI000AAA33F6|nr:hypothetical protein [Bacillus sp. FJAT-27251]
MEGKFYSEVAVPIQHPFGFTPAGNEQRDFTFDRDDRWTDYFVTNDGESYTVSFDDRGNWFFLASFECHSLDELKLSRQIFRPEYLEDKKLPLIDLLQELELEPIYEGHDKAYGHVLTIVHNVDDVPPFTQGRLANYDGPDDPTIIKRIHFIENELNGEKTRFITGFETRSFATITDNQYYAEKIHLPDNARDYLKLFVYFSRNGLLPSQQMMPRFLANLWASAQSLNHKANPALYKMEEIS